MKKNKNILLLKTLLLSTSRRNLYKYTTDKKKKRRIIGNYVGLFFLYLMLMGYSIMTCIGFGTVGMIDVAPLMCALIISMLSFVFTVLKTNGYLFNFKEYDMLMSLPFESKTVAACKFLYMYVKSLPWYLSISVAIMLGYAFYAHPPVFAYILWIVLSFILPIIPMLIASFIGFLIAKVSSGFRKTNIVQTILSFIFVIFCFSLRYIIEAMFKDDKVESTLESLAEITENTAGIYLPAKWFSGAVTKLGISDILLLAGVSILLFCAVFYVVGKSYRNINSALKSHAAAKKYKMTGQKKHSIVQTIAFKELRRLTGSSTYMVNGAIGEIMAALIGIVALFFGIDKIIGTVMQGAPIDANMIAPAIPFVTYFFIGMMATTACTPSLEGKNYWIMQSLPIEKKTLYQGKMLFNMYLTVPFMLFSTVCLCISAKVPVLETILYIILGLALCAFSTAWGCVCGIKHMRLDWENEIEVIKQGAAVSIYLLPNMIVTMGLIVLAVFLGTKIDHKLVAILFTVVELILAALSYLRVMALSKR